MELNKYQLLASRTAPKLSQREGILNAVIGISAEGGEVSDVVKKHMYQGHDLDVKEIAKEAGDLMWYLSMLATFIGYDLQEIAEMNIEKLEKRYPSGEFSTVDSIKRVDTL